MLNNFINITRQQAGLLLVCCTLSQHAAQSKERSEENRLPSSFFFDFFTSLCSPLTKHLEHARSRFHQIRVEKHLQTGLEPGYRLLIHQSPSIIQLSPKGEEHSGGLITRRTASGYISRTMNRPLGVSCFSIYIRNQLDKNQKGTFFANKRRRLVRVCLRFNWQCFRDQLLWFCSKFSKKILFYWPVNADKRNFFSFLVFVGAAASFTAKISSFETVAKRDAESCPKTVNIQGYSELRKTIRTRENCYPLIWWILIKTRLCSFFELHLPVSISDNTSTALILSLSFSMILALLKRLPWLPW